MNTYFKAKKIDSDEWIIGFFTKKKINNLIVPVIEVCKEYDSGDYIETYEIDGNTLISLSDWYDVNDINHLMPPNQDFLIKLENGEIRRYFEDWENDLLVTHWKPF